MFNRLVFNDLARRKQAHKQTSKEKWLIEYHAGMQWRLARSLVILELCLVLTNNPKVLWFVNHVGYEDQKIFVLFTRLLFDGVSCLRAEEYEVGTQWNVEPFLWTTIDESVRFEIDQIKMRLLFAKQVSVRENQRAMHSQWSWAMESAYQDELTWCSIYNCRCLLRTTCVKCQI